MPPRRANQRPPKRQVEPCAHKGAVRANNPPVGLVTPQTDPDRSEQRTCKLNSGMNVNQIEKRARSIGEPLSDGLALTTDEHRHMLASLSEHGVSQEAAENLIGRDSSNRRLAGDLHKHLQ